MTKRSAASSNGGRLAARREELVDRVDRHQLDAGRGIDLFAGHDGQRVGHGGGVARVAIMIGVLEQLALGAEERVIDAPRIDGDAGQRRVAHERERVPHLAPQGLDVPAQRPCLCQRRVREAMELVDADQSALEARQNGAAAFGSEIERKVRLSESLRPYDIAPYAQQGFGQRNVYSRSEYAPSRRRSRRITTTSPRQLARRGVDAEALVARAMAFNVAVPTWGLGSGGTRFARFRDSRRAAQRVREARGLRGGVQAHARHAGHLPSYSLGQGRGTPASCGRVAHARGLFIDSMNSNTFQDHAGQPLSYKFGSLSHTDAAVRRQAIEHNLECLEIGAALGARAHTVWIGDGGNFPGQLHFRRALDRYLDSMKAIYRALPENWRLFIEHKFYEPAFYSTVLNDWGTSYYCARELGDRAFSLVDLGHHAPNVNVEMIVARLIQFGKLGGFHFNDSQYGDDDLDAGSVKPFQLFLIFNELVDAERSGVPGFSPAYMLDQSHNVTDPIESLIASSIELSRAYVQAHLVDRDALAAYQEANDPLMALQTLKQAYTTDVSPDPGDGAAASRRRDRSDRGVSVERVPAADGGAAPGASARSSAGIV